MTEPREPRPNARRAWRGAVLVLALWLAGCNRAAPPPDATQPDATGPQRTLADNDVARARDGSLLPTSGNLLPGGLTTPPPATNAPATPAAPQPPVHSSDDPSQPMSAEPLLDAGGFDPSPNSDADGGNAVHETDRNEPVKN